jgi:hypothetical protein
MTSLRKTALITGIIYLATFVSIPTLALYELIHGANYFIGPGPDTPVIVGGILEIIVALAGIGTAVALFPVLKKQNEALALGLVTSRVLEAGMIFAGVAFLLTAVTLRGTENSVVGHTLVIMYDRIFLVGQSFMPAVNDLLLGLLLYQSRLVPRTLALIGIVGAFVLVAGDIGVLFGHLEQRAPLTGLFALLVALFEFSLGVWLVVKGFSPSRITAGHVMTQQNAVLCALKKKKIKTACDFPQLDIENSSTLHMQSMGMLLLQHARDPKNDRTENSSEEAPDGCDVFMEEHGHNNEGGKIGKSKY